MLYPIKLLHNHCYTMSTGNNKDNHNLISSPWVSKLDSTIIFLELDWSDGLHVFFIFLVQYLCIDFEIKLKHCTSATHLSKLKHCFVHSWWLNDLTRTIIPDFSLYFLRERNCFPRDSENNSNMDLNTAHHHGLELILSHVSLELLTLFGPKLPFTISVYMAIAQQF